jgi:cytochrome c oxidase subunit 3
MAWASLKMRKFRAYWWYMLVTILCGVIFLAVKLVYEWPQKFDHFGAFIKKDKLEKYEAYLGNRHMEEKGLPKRTEISGHLHNHAALHDENVKEYEIALDPVNADPTNPNMDRPHFLYVPPTDKVATIEKEDVEYANMFLPKHSAYFASYFTITGLHGAHVLGGVIVFTYLWLPVGTKLYKRNPEHLANRVEVAGLFWHFVDLVWIFVFPLFYLL